MKKKIKFYEKLMLSKPTRKKERNSTLSNGESVNGIFSFLINNAILDQNRKKFYQQSFIEKTTPLEILRFELSKEAGNARYISKLPPQFRRDVTKIQLSLYEIGEMKRLLRFKGITDTSLTKAAYYMKYRKYKKGEYIFKQGDKSDNFYGIIEGTISLVYNYYDTRHFDNDNGVLKKSVEKLKMTKGWCFGEWAIIFSKPRTTDALCLTDVEVFYLTENIFSQYLAKEIYRSDTEKKNFITKKLPGIQINGIRCLLSGIVPCFYSKNDFVYKEGDYADNLFVVYQGECACKKYLGNNNNFRHDISMMDDLFKVDQGCMMGLEIISNEKKYQTNLIVKKDFTIIYKIPGEMLRKFRYNKENLMPLYNSQKQLMEECIDRATMRKKKFILNFLDKKASMGQDFFENKCKDKNFYNVFDSFVEESLKSYFKTRNNKDQRSVNKKNDVINYNFIKKNQNSNSNYHTAYGGFYKNILSNNSVNNSKSRDNTPTPGTSHTIIQVKKNTDANRINYNYDINKLKLCKNSNLDSPKSVKKNNNKNKYCLLIENNNKTKFEFPQEFKLRTSYNTIIQNNDENKTSSSPNIKNIFRSQKKDKIPNLFKSNIKMQKKTMRTLNIRKTNESNIVAKSDFFKNDKENINTKSFEFKIHTAREANTNESKYYSAEPNKSKTKHKKFDGKSLLMELKKNIPRIHLEEFGETIKEKEDKLKSDMNQRYETNNINGAGKLKPLNSGIFSLPLISSNVFYK